MTLTVQTLADLAGGDGVVDLSLGDEQRGAVRLTSGLDRARTERTQVEAAAVLDPAHGAGVADEHFVGLELRISTP